MVYTKSFTNLNKGPNYWPFVYNVYSKLIHTCSSLPFNRMYFTKKAGVAFILYLAGVVGVEPTSAVLETDILPLNYTPKRLFIITYPFDHFN